MGALTFTYEYKVRVALGAVDRVIPIESTVSRPLCEQRNACIKDTGIVSTRSPLSTALHGRSDRS